MNDVLTTLLNRHSDVEFELSGGTVKTQGMGRKDIERLLNNHVVADMLKGVEIEQHRQIAGRHRQRGN